MPAKKHPSLVMLVTPLCILLALTTPVRSSAQQQDEDRRQRPKLIEFDAPGAATVSSPVCAPFCGTVAYDNNDLGVVVGFYTDSNIVPHGFLRTPNGHITSFDAPGAGLGYGLNQGTAAYAINDLGVIAGQFQDPSYLYHGFVRYPDGSFTTFDAPGAGTSASQGTFAFDVNLQGTTAGIYIDGSNVYHGFVRSRARDHDCYSASRCPDNHFTSFDPTGSVFTYVCEETCLLSDGTVAGFYSDSSNISHGFVRQPDGTITEFDAPGAGTGAFQGTTAASINAQGEIAGYFVDSSNVLHGFLRDRNGSFTTFDDPNAGTGTYQGTVAYSINLEGATTGVYLDSSNIGHGFQRSPDGKFTNFDAPDASPVYIGTRPSTNNLEGVVTGWWADGQDLNHGFVWIPGGFLP